jgi:S1-C subfamily serine protease
VSKWWKSALSAILILLILGCIPSPTRESSPPTEDLAQTASVVEITTYFGAELGILDASNLTLTEKRVRSSAVKVTSLLEDGHGSGTYLIMYGKRVVVTAAHVVRDDASMLIVARDEEKVVGRVVFRDEEADLAFIVVPEIKTRTAIRYRPQLHYDERLIGASLTYTGFPSRHDLLTIRGYVASLEHGYVVANMFGWFGSSGSGVFDNHGRFIGIVSGIDVGGVGVFGVRIPLESIVWVAPVSQIDHEMLKIRILVADPPGTRKAFPGAAAPRRGGTRD